MIRLFIHLSDLPDDCYRDDVDDALRGIVKGKGRVSGGGVDFDGTGVDFDLEFDSDEQVMIDNFLQTLVDYLRSLPAPAESHILVASTNGVTQIDV